MKRISLNISNIVFYFVISILISTNPSTSGKPKEDENKGIESPAKQKKQKTSASEESDLEEEEADDENDVPVGTIKKVKVFHLLEQQELDYFEVLKTENSSKEFEFENYDCQINHGAVWFRRTQTKSKPHSWGIISRGTGQPIRSDNRPNTGEHWIYFVRRGAHNFAITFGQGDYFNPGCVDSSFGSRIVRSTVQEPKSNKEVFAGKPSIDLGSKMVGKDYCLLTRNTTLEDIPALCDRLLELSQSYLNETYLRAKAFLSEVVPTPAQESDEKKEEKDEEDVPPLLSGESTEKNGITYINFFGKTFTVKGEYEVSLDTFLREQQVFTAKTFGPFLSQVNKGEDEGAFNLRVAKANSSSLIHMDKVLVKKTEICDLFQDKHQATPHTLFHVKLGTKGAVLNHLFGQGNASGELLAQDEAERRNLPMQALRQSFLGIICDFTNQKLQEIQGDVTQLLDQKKSLKEKIDNEKQDKKEDAGKGAEDVAVDQAEEEFSSDIVQEAKGETPLKKRTREKEVKRELTTGKVAPLFKLIEKVQPTINASVPEKEHAQVCARLRKLLSPYRYDLFKKEVDKIFATNKPLEGKIKQVKALLKDKFKSLAPEGIEKTIDELVTNKGKLEKFTEKFDPGTTTIVYGIGVDQDRLDQAYQKDTLPRLIPLGPRINLVRYVESLKKRGYSVHVKFIPDMNQKEKKEAKAVVPQTQKKAGAPAVKSAKKKGKTKKEKEEDLKRGQTSLLTLGFSNVSSSAVSKSKDEESSQHQPKKISFQNFLTTNQVEPFSKLMVDYRQERPNDPSLRDDYIIGPTLEDGDCFFHASFTEDGQDQETMVRLSADLRGGLSGIVGQSDANKVKVKREMLAELKNANGRHDLQDLLLEEAFNAVHSNFKHEKIRQYVRNGITQETCDALFQRNYTDLTADEQAVVSEHVAAKMPQFLERTLHTEEDYLGLIPDESVAGYIERHSVNQHNSSSYIEIPAGRNENIGLGSVLAQHKGKRIHCFLFASGQNQLNYNGTIGSLDPQAETVAILYHLSHYWSLFHPDEPEKRKNGIMQAAKNAGFSFDGQN